ncbi:Type II secretion system (T2SS), protein F [Lachnospiraceae bacterium C10]|nr:Type II secretion system (T2SS), protein F [Lachnospiraceae bacterium C10]
MVILLTGLLFVLLFGIVQGIVHLIQGTTPVKEAKKQLERIRNSQGFTRFIYDKQIALKKMGAGVLLKDRLTVSQWYLYKALMAGLFGLIAFFISAGVIKSDMAKPISIFAAVIGWAFLDLLLRLQNKSSNDEMMPDIMEMSRSVLYGKRGGQYIADALRDAVIVVENKRLKTALMRLRNDLDSGIGLDECLDELELSFSNGEISSFCTVIKSLQSTGQVDEALRTLENNIEREQASVNKRRCMILEHKTMMYVIFIAMDLMVMILYCIIMKLLEMQIGF